MATRRFARYMKMVKLTIKKGDEVQFLYETTVTQLVDEVLKDVSAIYNGRLKVQRLCSEMEMLADHGITLPPNMQGLTDEQITDLKLKDEWEERCVPSGGAVFTQDKIGRRNGHAPNEKMQELLKKTIKEAKEKIDKAVFNLDICYPSVDDKKVTIFGVLKQAQANILVTQPTVKEALDILRGAVMIVYPMGLPPHDPIKMEFDNEEDLSGTQASLEVIEESNASLWFSGKEMMRGKKLMDFVGKNEKTKIIAKLQKRGQGAPGREPVVSEEDQKQMMMYYYKKQEEMKKLEAEKDDSYLDSAWADNGALKRQFQGLNNIKFGPR